MWKVEGLPCGVIAVGVLPVLACAPWMASILTGAVSAAQLQPQGQECTLKSANTPPSGVLPFILVALSWPEGVSCRLVLVSIMSQPASTLHIPLL